MVTSVKTSFTKTKYKNQNFYLIIYQLFVSMIYIDEYSIQLWEY